MQGSLKQKLERLKSLKTGAIVLRAWPIVHYKDFWSRFSLITRSSLTGIVHRELAADSRFSLELTTLAETGHVRLIR